MDKMYDEGGLATDGMDVDPVSGNDIPAGSNAKDVRDDVDVKLSEGEYVVPADVVKYIGVAQLEKLVDKAKMGLEDMAANGRIGGETPTVTLEGMAAGGLISNEDTNGILDRIKEAAREDPSIKNTLKAKGIYLEANDPSKASPVMMAEGGVVESPLVDKYDPANYASSFNPYTHTPGFSAETGATGSAPSVPGTPTPIESTTPVCPPGSLWDPVQNACVLVQQPRAKRSSDNALNGAAGVLDQMDPNAWMEKFDYSNPETLFENTMKTIGAGSEEEEGGESKGLLGGLADVAKGIFAGGIIGKFMATNNAAQAAANSIVLRDMGRDDLADKIDAQYGAYVKSSGIELVPEAWRDGDRLAASIKDNRKDLLSGWGASAAKAPVVSQEGLGARQMPGPSDTWSQTSSPNAAKAAASLSSRASESSSAKMLRGLKDAQKIAQTAADTGKTIAQVGRDKASSTVKPKETASDKAAKTAGATRSGGGREYGMAKGGLVAKPKAKTKPTKKTTNKKGLGRK